MPFGFVQQRYTASRRVEGYARLAVQEIVEETAALRLAGAKSRLSNTLEFLFTSREYAVLTAFLQQYRTRDFSLLGQGGGGELEIGHRLLQGRPSITLRLQGAFGLNELAGSLTQAAAGFLTGKPTVSEVVAPVYAAAGGGFQIGSGNRLGRASAPGTLAYRLETWLGWMAAPNRVGFEVRGTFGVALPLGSLQLYAEYATDRVTAPGQPYLVTGLHYALNLAD
jgi:hypothetical protein